MTHYLRFSTASQPAHDHDDEAQAASNRTSTTDREANLSVAGYSRLHPTLASPRVWRHKSILTGKLDARSACELEEEIECLCQEGVTSLTLDVRRLEAIDPAGATVIAFRGAAWRGRGHDFAVIAESRVARRALTEAGAAALLTLDRNEDIVRGYSENLVPDRSTAMINHL